MLYEVITLLCLTGVVVAGLAFAGFFGLRQWLFQRWPLPPPGVQRVLIVPGSSLPQIALQLEQAGVVSDADRFGKLARWREVAQKLKAGEYEFSKAATSYNFV